MTDPPSIEGLLEKAFELACFIQRDREAAVRIVARALAKLEVVTAAQGKRLYYKPSGRRWLLHSRPFRNRISFGEAHLLQRLIYIESEPYEIAQEHGNGKHDTCDEDLVIHFVKHLVRKTIKRNSFYVTLGLGRLLHSYTTAETMDIYNAVIQDPDRVKDDYYFRSRKGALMQELKQRFGDLIRVSHRSRGEERFETHDNPSHFAQLVRECLRVFTPWNTPCLVPAGVDPIRDGIPSLSFRGRDDEDGVEVNRIHALLHPDCFYRLIDDLRFDAPEKRLTVPRFYTNGRNNNGSNDGRRTAKLNEAEVTAIKRELDQNAVSRKSAHTGLLRVLVDGNERARFDVNERRSTRFRLERDGELIEVRSRDKTGEEVLLALHPIAYAEAVDESQPADTSITLEGGQEISIVVSPATGDLGRVVDISYRERTASFWFYQLTPSIRSSAFGKIRSGQRILAPTLGVLVLIVGLIAIINYSRQRITLRQNQAGEVQKLDTATPNEVPTTANSATDKNVTGNAAETSRQQRPGAAASAKPGNLARNPAHARLETTTETETATETTGETRSLKTRRVALPLSAVSKVYVEVTGNEILRQELSRALSEQLRSSEGISLVANRADAEALLQVSPAQTTEAESKLTVVELINRGGQVIWRETVAANTGNSAADISARIGKDLLAAIQKAKQRR